MSRFRHLLAVILVALSCVSAGGQTTGARPERGVSNGGPYSVSDVESVSLTGGNVNLSIPLASLPPVAGGRLSFTLSAFYNSKLWDVGREEVRNGLKIYVVDQPRLSDRGGWNLTGEYAVRFREVTEDYRYVHPASASETNPSDFYNMTQRWYKAVLLTPDGGEHELRPLDASSLYQRSSFERPYLNGYYSVTPDNSNVPMRYFTIDGTYLSVVINPAGSATRFTLYQKDGVRVEGYNAQLSGGVSQRVIDPYGNAIKFYGDAGGYHVEDERTERRLTVTSPAQDVTRVTYDVGGGTPRHVDINWGTTTVTGKLYKVRDVNPNAPPADLENGECDRHERLTPESIKVIRSIVFPATEPGRPGRQFSFDYESDATETVTTENVKYACAAEATTYTRTASRGMGALSRMVAPAGAVVEYDYTLAAQHDFLFSADEMTEETLTRKRVTYEDAAAPGGHVTYTWTYDIEGRLGNGYVHAPDGSVDGEVTYPSDPRWGLYGSQSGGLSGLSFRSMRSGRVMTERRWKSTPFAGANTTRTGVLSVSQAVFNPVVEAEYTTLLEPDAAGVLRAVKMSAKTYKHDYNGNVTEVKEYDWFDPIPASDRDELGVPREVPAGATLLRTITTSYHNSPTDADSPEVYAGRALPAVGSYVLSAAKETTTGPGVTRFSYDGQAYGAAPTKGSVTKVESFDDQGDANTSNDRWVTTQRAYDPTYGNLVTATDANGNVTAYTYGDATHALPTKVEVDPLNGTGVQSAETAYDFSTGLVLSTTDANGQTTTVDYTNQLLGTVDPFGRPGVVRAPAGTDAGGATLYRKVYTFYEDEALRVRTESDLNVEDDRLLKGRSTSDQLGRVVLAEQSEDGSTYTISARTVYAEAGRVSLQSSPARDSQPEGWTRVTRDVLGRVVEAATFGGAAQPSATAAADTVANWTGSVTTSYRANVTTVADQAGRKRRSVSDGLGPLVRVDEPDKATGALDNEGNPVQPTSYAYDAPGNLRRVDQGGQQRFFLYDSLSRLVRAKNPEQGNFVPDTGTNPDFPAVTDPAFGNTGGQWSTGYRYDEAGNLLKRKDARGVTTTYTYDGLNRNTLAHYDDAVLGPENHTPDVTRSYDGAVKGKGRPWKSESAQTGRTAVEEYDAAGRPLSQSQKFWAGAAWGDPYTASYTYDLAGNVRTQTYPSGHSVSYAYDSAGRLGGFTGNLGDGAARTYADSFAYDAAGRVRQERFGTQTPLYHKRHFNSRGQLFDIRLSTASWAADEWDWNRGAVVNYYSGNYTWEGNPDTTAAADNNGNLRRQEVYVPLNDAGSYTRGAAGPYYEAQQTYDYDALNRLKWVAEAAAVNGAVVPDSFKQAYDYDRWGNRTINAQETQVYGQNPGYTIPEPQFAVDQNTNRLGVPSGQAGRMDYDAAGNLVNDSYSPGGYGSTAAVQTRFYNAENRMTAAANKDGGTTSYAYDADGRRVRRNVGTQGEVWQVYGAGGELLAEYAKDALPNSPQKEYGYRGGELLVTCEPAAAGWGEPPAFTDEHLAGKVVQSLFVTELRQAIDVLRAHKGLGAYGWASAVGHGDVVTAESFLELRRALDEALGAPAGGYTPGLASRRPILAVFLEELRARVLGAWQTGTGGTNIRWLVNDQLGTPRMIVDKTGSLAGVTRHDYLPFGEELYAGTGGRMTTRGYSGADTARQKFTGKERDAETNLDYFLARYYSSVQGRFTSPDEFQGGPHDVSILGTGHPEKQALPYAEISNPQSLNKYQYCLNNPLRFIDPDGHQEDIAIESFRIAYVAGGAATITLEVVGTTAAIGGGAPVVGAAAVVVTVTAAAAATYYFVLKDLPSRRNNTATNRSMMPQEVPGTNVPNAAVNANMSPGMQTANKDTLKKAAGQVGYALEHIGHLQNGKPNCPPGSQCYDDNKDKWLDEIKGAIRKLERYAKRLKGKSREGVEKAIEQIKSDAGIQ